MAVPCLVDLRKFCLNTLYLIEISWNKGIQSNAEYYSYILSNDRLCSPSSLVAIACRSWKRYNFFILSCIILNVAGTKKVIINSIKVSKVNKSISPKSGKNIGSVAPAVQELWPVEVEKMCNFWQYLTLYWNWQELKEIFTNIKVSNVQKNIMVTSGENMCSVASIV